jgi:hypothetical protein
MQKAPTKKILKSLPEKSFWRGFSFFACLSARRALSGKASFNNPSDTLERNMARTGELKNDIGLLIQNVARMFASAGNAKLVSLLTFSNFSAQQTHSESYSDEVAAYGYTIYLDISHSLYAQIKDEIEDISEIIKAALSTFMHLYENSWVEKIAISPQLINSDTWQDDAKSWLAGDGVNNQGRVRSDNIAGRECDGLLFRSQPEINLYKALKDEGVTFAPLAVFLKGGQTYSRIEPDFIIVKEGIVLCIEIDGDTVHTESPAEANDRTRILSHEGVVVERYSAKRCETNDTARKLAEEIISTIACHKANRS